MLVNVQARELELGSGGFDVLHANLTRGLGLAPSPAAHVMTLPYTPLQTAVPHAEEDGELASSLDGLPVVCCSLHSQLVPVCAALAGRRVAYLQLGGGALPVALSDAVRALRARGLLEVAVAVSPCVGGDVQCVNPWSALAWAKAQGYDAAVCAVGPGIVVAPRPRRARGRDGRERRGRPRRPRDRRRTRVRSRSSRASPGTLPSHARSAGRVPRRAGARMAGGLRRSAGRRCRGGRRGLARRVRGPPALAHGPRPGRRPLVLRGSVRSGPPGRHLQLTRGQSVPLP